MALLLAALAAAAPSAAALDLFEDELQLSASEARVLIRLPEGGTVRVEADAPMSATVVAPGQAGREFAPAPARFDVVPEAPETAWHGLPGTVELVLRREAPWRDVEVRITDDTGSGFTFTWPAARRPVASPSLACALAAVALAWRLVPPRSSLATPSASR